MRKTSPGGAVDGEVQWSYLSGLLKRVFKNELCTCVNVAQEYSQSFNPGAGYVTVRVNNIRFFKFETNKFVCAGFCMYGCTTVSIFAVSVLVLSTGKSFKSFSFLSYNLFISKIGIDIKIYGFKQRQREL